MKKNIGLLSATLLLGVLCSYAQKVETTPEFPQRGQTFSIVFTPLSAASVTDTTQITDKDTAVTVVFTYSNLYDVPYRLPMTRQGAQWVATFPLARYATYATFTLESGNKVQKAAKDRHYTVPVCQNGKRVFSGYLYESYSLPAQMGKDPRVPAMQAKLLEEELALHPDNYEAKVRLLNNKMAASSGEQKEAYRKQALEVIAQNFYSNPGNMGLMNKTTMGYLIIGEKTRVDSIRTVVKVKYPNTEAGYEMRVDSIRDMENNEQRKNAAEAMLKSTPTKDAKYVSDLHEVLFRYYAEKKNTQKVLQHMAKIPADTSPYRGEALLRRARVLLMNGILPDTAVALTERAAAIASTFPAGVIRFFPETGHILPYVAPEVKRQVEMAAKANSFSLQALVLSAQGKKELATKKLEEALTLSKDKVTLSDAARYYRSNESFEKSYKLTKELVMNNQEDTAAQNMMKSDYLAWKKSSEGWNKEMADVSEHWRSQIIVALRKERMNKKSPGIANLVNIKGEPVAESELAGKILVIDFWATWCLPCMKEMPYVEAVYKKYKNDSRVVFMIVNSGSGNTLTDAQGWSGNKTYSFPVYYTNDKALGEKFGFNVIPTTLIIDSKGNIQFRNIGFEGPVIEYKIGTAIDLLLSEAENKLTTKP